MKYDVVMTPHIAVNFIRVVLDIIFSALLSFRTSFHKDALLLRGQKSLEISVQSQWWKSIC